MQIDFMTLACFRDEMDPLLGARVQNVLLLNRRSVGLELYAGQRHYLLVSADPTRPRILFTPEKLRRGVEADTPFLLLMRKWVRRAQLVDVTQPPWERILVLHFKGAAGDCQLVIELVGRYSNVVLVGPDGCVLEAIKHVGPDMSRYRVTLPAHPYRLPPLPPDRHPPARLSLADLTARLTGAPPDQTLRRWLMEHLLGVGPVVAREIAVRATGDADTLARVSEAQAVAQAVAELLAPLENGWWSPHIAFDADGQVVAFVPYPPQQFERAQAVPDINQAMWRYYEAEQLADAYAGVRQSVQKLICQAETRLKKRGEKLEKQRVDESEIDRLRIAGELLLTFQGRVFPNAQEVTLPGYAGQPVAIALDSKLTAVENAQAYFRRYEKARRAANRIPALIGELKVDHAYLAQLNADLKLAESRPEIDAVREALVQAGWARGRRRSTGALVSGPRRIEVGGFLILVGRNAKQNETVTFERAGPNDLWLHVRGLPGAHVVIKRARKKTPDAVIQQAAQLAAFYSQARDETGRVAVDVTERRFVRRLKGSHPGLVTYRNEKTIFVQPGLVE